MSPQRMPPPPVLETPRLVLRPIRTKDAPVLQRRFPHWDIVRHLSSVVPWPYPADGAATFIARCLEEHAAGEKNHWAIIPKEGPAEMIGCIDLWPDDGHSHDMRAFWLDPEFQRRGLMMEAAQRVTAYAFCELRWPHLWLSNAQENHASRRIKEKQGARLVDLVIRQQVGGKGEVMVWQLMRREWLARHPEQAPQKKKAAA
jgi:ribosomal-protein-alanine N-acetyltransferase